MVLRYIDMRHSLHNVHGEEEPLGKERGKYVIKMGDEVKLILTR